MFVGDSWTARSLRRDILCYYVYEATAAITLYRPVMFIYFRALGLSWTQIAILEALGSFVKVTTEVPTGYVGDRIGRRNSMLVGTAMVTVALAGIAMAASFLILLAFYPLWTLGWNFRRGADAAWLYDRLSVAGVTERFAEVKGRAKAVAAAVGVLAALVGGLLGAIDLALPFLAAAGVTALGLPPMLALRNVEGRDDRDQPSPREAAGIIRRALSSPAIGPFVVYYFVLFASAVAVVFMYEQPVVRDLAMDFGFEGSVPVLLGGLYAAISLVSATLSYHTGFIAERVGLRRWFTAVPLLAGVGLLGLLVFPLLAIPAILLARGVADVSRTLANQYVNDHLGDAARATVLSATILVSSLAAIPFQLGSGRLADAGLTTAEVLAVTGGVLTVGALLLGRWTFSRFQPYEPSMQPGGD